MLGIPCYIVRRYSLAVPCVAPARTVLELLFFSHVQPHSNPTSFLLQIARDRVDRTVLVTEKDVAVAVLRLMELEKGENT